MSKRHRKARQLIEEMRALDKTIEEGAALLKALEGGKAEILANMLTESPGGRTISIGEMLNDEQIQAVVDIMNRPGLDDLAVTKMLKSYLGQFNLQLSAIGVNPDYLAYLLLANAPALRQASAASNNKPDEPTMPPNSQN